VRVGHLPAREHTRVAGLYSSANVLAGKKLYPCPHPASIGFTCAHKAKQGTGHWTAGWTVTQGCRLGSGLRRQVVTSPRSSEKAVGPGAQRLVAHWRGRRRRRTAGGAAGEGGESRTAGGTVGEGGGRRPGEPGVARCAASTFCGPAAGIDVPPPAVHSRQDLDAPCTGERNEGEGAAWWGSGGRGEGGAGDVWCVRVC
jgi:hypothetical protein